MSKDVRLFLIFAGIGILIWLIARKGATVAAATPLSAIPEADVALPFTVPSTLAPGNAPSVASKLTQY